MTALEEAEETNKGLLVKSVPFISRKKALLKEEERATVVKEEVNKSWKGEDPKQAC